MSQAGDFHLTFSADGQAFQGLWRIGNSGDFQKTPWNGRRDSSKVTVGIIPHSFFINQVLAPRQYLHAVDKTIHGDTSTVIEFQSVGTLDTINRFVRLAAVLNWSYPDLDWVLNTLNTPSVEHGNLTCKTELTKTTIIELAKIQLLVTKYSLPLELATCMWFDIPHRLQLWKVSTAAHDIIFNNRLLKQFLAEGLSPNDCATPWS